MSYGELPPQGRVKVQTPGTLALGRQTQTPRTLASGPMGRLVNVHCMEKEALLTNNANGDEQTIVFDTSPSYDEIVAKDVSKEKVDQSEDKSIKLFATKVEPPRGEIDLNQLVSSLMNERRSVPFVEQRIMIDASNAYSQPPTSKESEVELHAPNACSPPQTSQANEVDVIASEEVIQKDGGGDGDVDGDFDEVEEGFHGIDVGDLDAYIAQKEMDHELPFRRLYGYDSDDGGDQYRDAIWRKHLFNESLACEEERERREKENKEKKKREEEKKRKEKQARQEERARKLAKARDVQAEDEVRDKKRKWTRTNE
ncbi:hypothetical protein D1007_09732 [Hordeum vulgare]|nr:hypothetical protein D1007_09732 [Hordeum vulgare]